MKRYVNKFNETYGWDEREEVRSIVRKGNERLYKELIKIYSKYRGKDSRKFTQIRYMLENVITIIENEMRDFFET